MQKVLEVARNGPGEIQDVNYRGLGENNNCDFDFLKRMETIKKDRLNRCLNDRLHFSNKYRTQENPAGNLTAMEDQGACTP